MEIKVKDIYGFSEQSGIKYIRITKREKMGKVWLVHYNILHKDMTSDSAYSDEDTFKVEIENKWMWKCEDFETLDKDEVFAKLLLLGL